MPRRNRAQRTGPPLRGGLAPMRTETGTDGEWIVRHMPGARSSKLYRCPGCQQEIHPGSSHVVAWPAGEQGTVEDRRHWHRACWESRAHRRPTSRRW